MRGLGLLCALLSGCFPTPNFHDQRPCEDGVTPCATGQVCIDSFCQAQTGARRQGVDLNGRVLRTADDQLVPLPVAEAIVEIAGAGLFGQTDEAGQFRLRAVPPGTYELVVLTPTAPAGAPSRYEAPPVGRFDLVVDEADVGGTLNRDLLLNPVGELTGRVIFEGVDPFADEHGGAVVFVPGVRRAGDITSPDGTFLISGIPAGEHEIRVESATHGPVSFTAQVDALARNWVDVSDPITLMNQSRERRIEGQVSSPTLRSLDQLTLIAFPLFGTIEQTVALDADGGFQLDIEEFGPYAIALRGEGVRPAQVTGLVAGQTGVELLAVAVEGNDLDEDGIIDSEDTDSDGDGCENSVDDLPLDPRGCTDSDGDALADDLDSDDECDGASDVEEARPGRDGLVSDHRSVNTTEDGVVILEQGDAAAMSADGVLIVREAQGAASIEQPADGFRYVAETQQEGLIYGPYRLQLAAGENSVVDLVIPNHPAKPGDELQLLRRPAGCTSADCTVSARLSCERGGYRSWLRCEDRLTFNGEVDERLWWNH